MALPLRLTDDSGMQVFQPRWRARIPPCDRDRWGHRPPPRRPRCRAGLPRPGHAVQAGSSSRSLARTGSASSSARSAGRSSSSRPATAAIAGIAWLADVVELASALRVKPHPVERLTRVLRRGVHGSDQRPAAGRTDRVGDHRRAPRAGRLRADAAGRVDPRPERPMGAAGRQGTLGPPREPARTDRPFRRSRAPLADQRGPWFRGPGQRGRRGAELLPRSHAHRIAPWSPATRSRPTSTRCRSSAASPRSDAPRSWRSSAPPSDRRRPAERPDGLRRPGQSAPVRRNRQIDSAGQRRDHSRSSSSR